VSNKNVEAIYPFSAATGHALRDFTLQSESMSSSSPVPCMDLNLSAFEQGWQRIVERHSILRTGFVWKDQDEPLQVVLRRVEVPLEQQDWRGYQLPEQQEQLKAYFNAAQVVVSIYPSHLMRLALSRWEDIYQFIWTHHHPHGWLVRSLVIRFLSFYKRSAKVKIYNWNQSVPTETT